MTLCWLARDLFRSLIWRVTLSHSLLQSQERSCVTARLSVSQHYSVSPFLLTPSPLPHTQVKSMFLDIQTSKTTSAQPCGQKRMRITRELIRRQLNCSKERDCETRKKHLNRFMQLLKNSGYPRLKF